MVSFLLHLYQPSYQEDAIIKKIAEESYIPLVKVLKQQKNFKVTLNLPLSLLTLMESHGYSTWINDINTLVTQGRVELVGSGAYHPLLTKLPKEIVEEQIILNEYGLGYYFGKRTGFEGENAILISDLNGFFPPEMAINEELISTLSDLSYKWVVADHSAIVHLPEFPHGLYSLKDYTTKLIVRNRVLSNKIAFKRDDSLEGFTVSEFNNSVIVLDGETFGHHNKDGIYFLQDLIDYLNDSSTYFGTISEYFSEKECEDDVINLPSICESSWGASDKDVLANNPYPLWTNTSNKVQVLQWELLNTLLTTYQPSTILENDKISNIAIWDPLTLSDSLKSEEEVEQMININKVIGLLKLCSSDQFWWSSSVTLNSGEFLYDKHMISYAISLVEEYSNLYCSKDTQNDVKQIVTSINALIGL